jgi:hypothetical protein
MRVVDRIAQLARPNPADAGAFSAGEAEADRLLAFGVRLAVIAVALQTLSQLAHWFVFDGGLKDLGADEDVNVWAWASSAATVIAAFMALALADVLPRARGRLVVLTLILAFFSLDDLIRLHERVGTRFREDILGLGDGFGRVFWPLLFLPLLAAAFLLLWWLASRAPRRAGLAIRLSLGLLAFSVLAEEASAIIVRTVGAESAAYGIEVAIEEGAELGAWIVIAFALAATLAASLAARPAAAARS